MYINQKIQNAKDEQEAETRKFLQLNGWDFETISPGSIWLWCKTFGSIKICVAESTAVHVIMNDYDNEPKCLDDDCYIIKKSDSSKKVIHQSKLL